MSDNINDPIERIIADALTGAGIAFTHETTNKSQKLDFLLVDSGVYIECKQFASDRTGPQIAAFSDVIVIQGRKAAYAFASMINKAYYK